MAYGVYQQGVDAKNAARAQAAWAEHNAKVMRMQAEYEQKAALQASETHRKKAQVMLSNIRAQVGKSGVAMSGSPLLLYEDTANELEKERGNILEQGANRANQYMNQSILDMTKAKTYKKQGQAAYRSGLIGAASSAFGGYSEYKYKQSLLEN